MNFQSTSKLAGGSYEDIMNCAPAAAKGASYTMEEIAKQAKKGDVWSWRMAEFPTCPISCQLDMLTFAGKDASAVFDLIHPSDVHRKVRARCSHRHTWDKWWIRFCSRVQCVSSRASCCGWICGREVEGVRSGQQEPTEWTDTERLAFPSLVLSVTWCWPS